MLKILLQIAIVSGVSATWLPAANSRPNILFIVADDMRADSIHALGNEGIKTPNIDRLVKRGSAFTQVYSMGSTVSDVGASSRAVIMSGRSLFRFSGDISNSTDDMPLLPELLRKVGYTTFATGKWQNGRHWFERSFSHGAEIFFGDGSELQGFDFDKTGEYAEADGHHLNDHPNEVVTSAMSTFLENRPRGKPFFAYVGFTASNDPQNLPDTYRSMYAGNKPPLPKNFLSVPPFDIGNGGPNTPREKDGLASLTRGEAFERLVNYYGMISHLDAQVGLILDTLETNGVEDNTIIVFTSDNGRAVGSHGLRGDQNLYEHSVRVPLILAGPGIPRNKHYISTCYQMDVYPTIGEVVGITIPPTVEGKSLLPILTAQASEIRHTIYAAYMDQQRSIRDYRWKLIYYPKISRYQLFNLRNDPDEMNDRFSSGENGRDINRLRIQLSAWQSSLDDPLR